MACMHHCQPGLKCPYCGEYHTPPAPPASAATPVRLPNGRLNLREIFAQELERYCSPGLANMVRSGADNSKGGEAAMAALVRVEAVLMERPPGTWEQVGPGVTMMRRMAVPGGWIYRTEFTDGALVFVPTPKGA